MYVSAASVNSCSLFQKNQEQKINYCPYLAHQAAEYTSDLERLFILEVTLNITEKCFWCSWGL